MSGLTQMLSLPSSALFHRILARQRTASFAIGLLPSPLLDEDEDAQPPLGDNVWAFLQPLNRSMVPIELNKSVVLFGRLKATPPNADDQACQVVKLAGLVIS